MAEQKPSVGRIVHYVLPNGEHRPAIIVRVWGEPSTATSVQLQVFTDGGNDSLSNVEWRTSVNYSYSEEPKPDSEYQPQPLIYFDDFTVETDGKSK